VLGTGAGPAFDFLWRGNLPHQLPACKQKQNAGNLPCGKVMHLQWPNCADQFDEVCAAFDKAARTDRCCCGKCRFRDMSAERYGGIRGRRRLA